MVQYPFYHAHLKVSLRMWVLLEVFSEKMIYYLLRYLVALDQFVVVFFLDVDDWHLFTSF